MSDDDGAFAPLGCSLFVAPWLEKNEPETADAEMATIAGGGMQYFRMWGAVGEGGPVPADSWGDRTFGPQWPDYDAVIAGVFARAEAHKLRIQITLIADPVLSLAEASNRLAFVDRWAGLIRGREHLVQLVEIGNESGGKMPYSELLSLAKHLRSLVNVIVVPTRGCEYYNDNSFPMATMHYERENDADGGEYAWVWRPYEYQFFECPHRPGTASNNEPKGPWSSGEAEFDPARLVLGHWSPFVCNHATSVFHNGPGIRTGGQYDVARGIPKHIAEIPNWEQIASGLRARLRLCPPNLANFRLHNGHWGSNPLDFGGNTQFDNGTLFRAATAEDGLKFVAILLRVLQPVSIRARAAMRVREVDVLTGESIHEWDLAAGAVFQIAGAPGSAPPPHALLLGEFK